MLIIVILNNAIKNLISYTKTKKHLLQLSIIIINYNVKYFVEQCLYAVTNAIKNITAEVIVVDNNSTDGSKEFFKGKFEQAHFIFNDTNVGFSKANNIALKQTTGKYVLFLNPDTIVPADCFEKCLAFFETKKDIGALGVRMIDGAGNYLKESKRGFPSPFTSLFKICGLTNIFPTSKIFARYYLGNLQDDKNHIIDVLAGAFMLIEKRILNEVGAFDENFFMYGEDIDLSYRIQKAGYKNYYFAESTIIHFKGESTQKGNLLYAKLFYGAMELFVKKHHNKMEGLFYSFSIQALILSKTIAGYLKIFSNVANEQKVINHFMPAIIVADEKEYAAVVNLLNSAAAKLQLVGRVNATEVSPNNSLGNVAALPQLIKKYKVEKIIFCIDGLTVKEIIRILQSLKSHVGYSFHASGSRSIVASGDKNEAGNFIAAG